MRFVEINSISRMVVLMLILGMSSCSSFSAARHDGSADAGEALYKEEIRPTRSAGSYGAFIERIHGIVGIRKERQKQWSRSARPRVENGWLGIGMRETAFLREKVKADTIPPRPLVEVVQVVAGSPASSAGIRAGDLIYGVEGEALAGEGENPVPALASRVRSSVPGTSIRIEVLRDGSVIRLPVRIDERPKTAVPLSPHPEFELLADTPTALESVIDAEGLGPRVSEILDVFTESSLAADDLFRRASPYRLPEVQFVLQRPFFLPHAAWALGAGMDAVFRKADHRLVRFVDMAVDLIDRDEKPPVVRLEEEKGQNLASLLERLVTEVALAQALHQEIFSGIEESEWKPFEVWARSLLLREEAEAIEDAEAEEREHRKLLMITERMNVARWTRGVRPLLAAAEELAALQTVPDGADLSQLPESWRLIREGDVTSIHTPAGLLLIGDRGSSTFTEEAVIIVDLGGDDVYENCTGGGSADRPVSVAVDLGGNDIYHAPHDFCQGAAFMAAGILLDVSGNDRYSGVNYAQGAALLGLGVLGDKAGDDIYECNYVCQGAAAFGVGGMFDHGGNDMYSSALIAQGFGFTGGIGGLVDRRGDDIYFAGGVEPDHREPGKAYQSFSQGFGFGMRPGNHRPGASGGIGLLIDEKGNDIYVGDYFGQGAAYWYALGVLIDRDGLRPGSGPLHGLA